MLYSGLAFEPVFHSRFPDHFMLNTEACTGWTGPPSERGVHLGEWSRGSNYSHSIIEVLTKYSNLLNFLDVLMITMQLVYFVHLG